MITNAKRRFSFKYKLTKDKVKELDIIETPIGRAYIDSKKRYTVFRTKKGVKVSNIDFVLDIWFEELKTGHEFSSIGCYNSYIKKIYEIPKEKRKLYSCMKWRDVAKCSECLRCGHCCLTSKSGREEIW